jgi:D-threo-aldose 1-dehydrogenase
MRTRALGSTGLQVTEVCIGASPLGGMPAAYGYDVPEGRALEAVEAVFASPFNFLDTSNEYSDGRSEQRIGDVVRRTGLPDGFVLATKIDPSPGADELPAERVHASFQESIERLGVTTVPVLYLHDPERFSFESLTEPGGAVEAMQELRSAGLVEHIGIAGREIDLLRRFLDTGAFEVVLNHNQYTLMDQSAEPLIAHAIGSGVAFVNAAPYAGGILAKGPSGQSRYFYQEADADTVARIERLQSLCARYDVDLAVAALQFSTRDPRIASTVVGISKPERVAQLLENIESSIPESLWDELATTLSESGDR